MTPIKLLADMNISPQTVQTLQQNGWDVIRMTDVLYQSASDREILEWAGSNNRVIVTQDLDFSALLALSERHQPILITLRLGDADPSTVSHRLLLVLPQVLSALLEGSAITVTDTAVRVRGLPIR